LFFTLGEVEAMDAEYTIDDDPDIITVTPSGGTAPYTYSYDGGNTYVTDNTYDPSLPGDLIIYIQDANGCIFELAVFVSGIDDKSLLSDIKVYPNPVLEEFFINFALEEKSELSIEILNVNGHSVHKISKENYNSGENIVKIDLSSFASSIYIVKIASAEGYRYIKVIKT